MLRGGGISQCCSSIRVPEYTPDLNQSAFPDYLSDDDILEWNANKKAAEILVELGLSAKKSGDVLEWLVDLFNKFPKPASFRAILRQVNEDVSRPVAKVGS